MFSLFGLDKLASQILGGVLALGILVAGYYWWVHSIKQEAQREWNQKQIEQVQKENEKFVEHLNEVAKSQKKIIDDLNKRNDELEKKYSDLEKHLNDPVVIKKYIDKPTSNVLKKTFRELSK